MTAALAITAYYPDQHPRWDDQVEIEKEMLALGSERMQEKITKARQKHNMTGLRPYRSLLHEWVLPVSDGVTAWISRMEHGTKGGPKPVALPRMKQIDPDTAAVVAIKSILRMLGLEVRGILAIAKEIGTWCEHEARTKVWQSEEGEDWKKTQAIFLMRKSTAPHQRRSTISLFNERISDKVSWLDWTHDDRLRVGFELINIVCETTKRFHLAPDPDWVPKRIKGGAFAKRPIVLAPDPELDTWLAGAMDDELVHSPAFMPTLIPPLPWEGPRDGGYHTPFVKTPTLIRFKVHQEEQRQVALSEYDSLDMPNVYASINFIQNTAWAINDRVLDVAQNIWDQDLAIAGMVRQENEKVPVRPEGLARDHPVYVEWAHKASDVHTRNAQKVSHFISQRRTLQLAQRMRSEPSFYFPHMLDFRGRMYPIVSDISPQGGDLHRGLLTFAKPKPVDDLDSQWLAIHLANCYGVDKVSYAERVAWVKANEARWRSITGSPLEDRSWQDTDVSDPWQTLAAIFEWVRWLDEGAGMLSSLPIRVDGTCNGIQHLSAMVRDEVGGLAVNLVPGETPQDIYRDVADLVTIDLKSRPDDEWAVRWLAIFGGKVPRSMTKNPVMVTPYGGTRDAYFGGVRDWLNEHDQDFRYFSKKERVAAIQYLIPVLTRAVKEVVVKATEVMDWIQACCSVAGKAGVPITWTTPAGFHVRHFYGKVEMFRVRTRIDGQSIYLADYRATKDLDVQSQTRGIAPNFVHSMDASALMTCSLMARDAGIESMTCIHDSYGTVAGDMWTLFDCTRAAFVETYAQPVLGQFLAACRYVSGIETGWPEELPTGSLDLSAVLQSDYFFA